MSLWLKSLVDDEEEVMITDTLAITVSVWFAVSVLGLLIAASGGDKRESPHKAYWEVGVLTVLLWAVMLILSSPREQDFLLSPELKPAVAGCFSAWTVLALCNFIENCARYYNRE